METISNLKIVFENSSYDDFDEFKKDVMLFYITRSGGIAFLKDRADPSAWWIEAYTPGFIPQRRVLHFLLYAAGAGGCSTVRALVNDRSRPICQWLGMTNIDKETFEIRVD